jgi:hypothetical protein
VLARTWIRDRLESLAGLFGVEIAAFAVMSNHLHCVDLNPIRARLADRSQASELTSAHERIKALCCDDPGGLDGSSVARGGPWSDPAGVGVDPRTAPGLCRVVAGEDRPVRPPVPPGGGLVRISKSDARLSSTRERGLLG